MEELRKIIGKVLDVLRDMDGGTAMDVIIDGNVDAILDEME